MVMRDEWVELGGERVYVRRWGPDDGRPFLFLHSLGPAASGALLGPGIGPLGEAGIAIAAPDHPGFGQSPPVDADAYGVARLSERTWAIADALGWGNIVLSGHSWGGAVAVHAAAARPERVQALVLVDSGHLDYGDQPQADRTQSLEALSAEAEAARRRAPDRAGVAKDLELAPDDPVVTAFLEGMMGDGEGGLISRTLGSSRGAAMYHLMRSLQSEQWPAIGDARIPTLLLLATRPDEIRTMNEAGAARFLAAVPHADVRFIEGATHSLITDMRERFGATVASWLARHSGGVTPHV
jgi:pimeloyl-ACP methyl ester carboxylesterase